MAKKTTATTAKITSSWTLLQRWWIDWSFSCLANLWKAAFRNKPIPNSNNFLWRHIITTYNITTFIRRKRKKRSFLCKSWNWLRIRIQIRTHIMHYCMISHSCVVQYSSEIFSWKIRLLILSAYPWIYNLLYCWSTRQPLLGRVRPYLISCAIGNASSALIKKMEEQKIYVPGDILLYTIVEIDSSAKNIT